MLFGKNDSLDAEEFWKNREEEIGTPILGKTLGRVVQEGSTIPLWGLFYTSANSVFFQTFQSENWLSMVFSGGKGGRTKNEIIEIPLDAIESFRVQPQKSGLLKFFRKPPLVELSWKSTENGEAKSLLFEMDGDAEKFVSTLPR